jgi:hypothetical protein
VSTLAEHAGVELWDGSGNIRDEAMRAIFSKFDDDNSGTTNSNTTTCHSLILYPY